MTDRALIIKLSSLGDLVHALPAVHCLKTGTGMDIDWVTQPEYVDWVRCCPDVQRVVAFPRRRFWSGAPAFFHTLREQEYSLIVDLQGLLKSALLAGRMARGRRRVGPSFSREWARVFYSDSAGPPAGGARHAVDEALDVVRHLGLPDRPVEFPLVFPAFDVPYPAPRVALIPCSRWPAKNWPVGQFIELGRALRQQRGASIFALGGPADAAAGAAIKSGISHDVVNLCGKTTLVEMGSLLQRMHLVITVDSGPMHVAAALGVPVLALFGVTDPRRTGPYGKGHRVLLAEGFKACPELARSFKNGRLTGAWRISVEEVLGAALEMLG